ncbi:probable malonyl-CoA-acyl carrier protein transacylase, mitochondrial [Culicoides brevitarsis]|uniref:probable malonyl-CoA-acyl carrier protein transacylase, mitochondrial n=1 Tax=Culicoides brevitarsis TaxID=469753 RepID=UPI00307C7715
MIRHFIRKFSLNKSIRKDERPSKNISNLLDDALVFPERRQKQPLKEWSTLPYPEGTVFQRRDQGLKVLRPNINPRETSIILFPGQGSQFVGMGAQLVQIPEVLDMYEIASDILKYNLLEICLKGPKKDLDRTVFSQPAILVTSLACLERLKEERPNAIESCISTAGFSLGEISALVFAGVIPFDQAVRLVQIRAEAMQYASDLNQGGMAMILYGPDSKLNFAIKAAREWCAQKGTQQPDCVIANYLYPHCKVVAGSEEALSFIEKNANVFNIKRVKRLPVSGAFHSTLMKAAVEPFRAALNKIKLDDPAIAVHSNIDGMPYKNADHIKNQLPMQIIKPVKWEQTLHILYERRDGESFPRTFECGPGQGLRAILKQVNAKAWNTSYNIEP